MTNQARFMRILAYFILISLLASGCASGASTPKNPQEQGATASAQASTEPQASAEAFETPPLDLSTMSSNIVYATVYDILMTPKNYEGRRIIIAGSYLLRHVEGSAASERCLIITDQTACCEAGLILDCDAKLVEGIAQNAKVIVSGLLQVDAYDDSVSLKADQITLDSVDTR